MLQAFEAIPRMPPVVHTRKIRSVRAFHTFCISRLISQFANVSVCNAGVEIAATLRFAGVSAALIIGLGTATPPGLRRRGAMLVK